MRTINELRTEFPIEAGGMTIRFLERQDLELLAGWDGYAFPYSGFDLSFGGMTRDARDDAFQLLKDQKDRATLVIDYHENKCIGFITLSHIDWENGTVGHFGIRVQPAWCGQGYGTLAIIALSNWMGVNGFDTIRTDVASSNARALKAFRKARFAPVDEVFRPAKDSARMDLKGSAMYLRRHRREIDGVPHLRFFKLERRI